MSLFVRKSVYLVDYSLEKVYSLPQFWIIAVR